jgi:hypothetical protein
MGGHRCARPQTAGVISNCTNKNSEISIHGSFVGGIVGENHGIVENCTCQDNDAVITSDSSIGSTAYSGGIAGNNSRLITNCTIANNSINNNGGWGYCRIKLWNNR